MRTRRLLILISTCAATSLAGTATTAVMSPQTAFASKVSHPLTITGTGHPPPAKSAPLTSSSGN